jgi:glycosyltransferase involved in cell wall biosynthesis
MRSVMVTKFVPLPANSGGKRRSLAVATRLARRGPVTLCAFDDGSADVAGLAELGIEVRRAPWHPSAAVIARGLVRTRSASAARFASGALAVEIRTAATAPVDLLQVEYTQLAPYARALNARTRLLDLHNVESAAMRSLGAIRPAPMRALLTAEAVALAAIERRAVREFDAVAVVSEAERARIGQAPAQVLVCPNGWEVEAALPFGDEPVVAFVALLGWGPNEDAAVWLAEDVWPAVRARVASARLLLVGRDPSERVRALAGNSIEVTGSVPDVRPYLARARVATAPLRAGGGSRLKVIEALGAGRPVVATGIGAEGLLDLEGRGLIVADSAPAFADAMVGLLGDRERAERLGRAGHAAVSATYSWDATLRPLLAFVDERA